MPSYSSQILTLPALPWVTLIALFRVIRYANFLPCSPLPIPNSKAITSVPHQI
ncbi:unknown protein [Microcystis aeruginosa NIES-843]|uniref:Uncharacterized protein n=1 Tax=Microcystis aeruginosa (strain NIES-843 / IAM M-2473) TaxID=449447 RepID=B0JJW5_MICAN|nr:unknown protein [Microcystis aeruginosa NIES-843]